MSAGGEARHLFSGAASGSTNSSLMGEQEGLCGQNSPPAGSRKTPAPWLRGGCRLPPVPATPRGHPNIYQLLLGTEQLFWRVKTPNWGPKATGNKTGRGRAQRWGFGVIGTFPVRTGAAPWMGSSKLQNSTNVKMGLKI